MGNNHVVFFSAVTSTNIYCNISNFCYHLIIRLQNSSNNCKCVSVNKIGHNKNHIIFSFVNFTLLSKNSFSLLQTNQMLFG